MEIRPIRNDDDHRAALQEIERLWAYPNTSPENDKLDVLATLVEVYESRRWPTRGCSQIKILQYAVSDMGRTRAELADLLGSRSRSSELLRAKRRISLAVAQKISLVWGIPIQLLVAPYELAA